MRKSLVNEQHITAILKEHKASTSTAEVCSRHEISQPALDELKAKYDELKRRHGDRLKALEEQNRQLKKLLAKQLVEDPTLRDFVNLMLRLSAVYSRESMAEIIDGEANGFASPPRSNGAGVAGGDLSGMVERYLARYFASFGMNQPPPGLYRRILRQIEKPLIKAALTASHGNQNRAANLLGLHRNTLRERIETLDVEIRARDG